MKQPKNYTEWLKSEGAIEHPTHLETLRKPEQQTRIKWLKEHTNKATEILDIGCNWGYILNELKGKCGVDINIENIEKAKKEFPLRSFLCADVTKGLPFKESQFAVVIMADILEHLEWHKVESVLKEGLRIARRKLLITLPYLQTEDCACCFKHRWIPHKEHIGEIVVWFAHHARKVSLEYDSHFVYMEVFKW